MGALRRCATTALGCACSQAGQDERKNRWMMIPSCVCEPVECSAKYGGQGVVDRSLSTSRLDFGYSAAAAAAAAATARGSSGIVGARGGSRMQLAVVSESGCDVDDGRIVTVSCQIPFRVVQAAR